MEEKNYRLIGELNLAVPADHADKLISLGDGTSALLYLYALRTNGTFSPERAAADLRRTQGEIIKAAELLRDKGLFSPVNEKRFAPLPSEELPEYTAEDIAASSNNGSEFKALVDETQRILGKMLSGSDLKILFGIYDYLGLPTEVIFMLINHCVEDTKQRLGPGRLPTMRSIEKEAYIWFNREILTFDQAENFLHQKRQRSELQSEIKHILQINGRNLSATERSYVDSWLEMGFTSEAIAIAYDKTVIKTGGLTWKYMNSILMSWHSKNLHTAEQVEKGDVRPSANQASKTCGNASFSKAAGGDDAELLKKILNQSKNG